MADPTDFLVLRYSSQHDSTLGLLFHVKQELPKMLGGPYESVRRFIAFTLEDEYRTLKVSGETRIPAGRYKLALRTFGSHHNRYRRKFPDIHRGMIEITDVHGFTDILIHIGNRDTETAGCLLVGSTAEANITAPGWIGSSTSAYLRIYPVIAQMIENRESVFIRYEDFDSPVTA